MKFNLILFILSWTYFLQVEKCNAQTNYIHKSDSSERYLLLDENNYYFSHDHGSRQCSIYSLGNTYSEDSVTELIAQINLFFENYLFNRADTVLEAECGGEGLDHFIFCALSHIFPNRQSFQYRNQDEYKKFVQLSRGEEIKEFDYYCKSCKLQGDYYLKKRYVVIKVNED